MHAYWTLTRRELSGYFISLAGYVIIAANVFLLGLSFVDLLTNLRSEPSPMPVTELFYNTWFLWLIPVVTTPAITMRLFAQEKFSGTFETLMTTPVSDLEVVLAKFTAGLTFYILAWLPLLACVLLVRRYSAVSTPVDVGILGSTFLGIFLLGCLFVSLGCCASAMTRSQTTAAMLSLAFGFGLFLLNFLPTRMPQRGDWRAQFLASFALFDQMHDFCRGVVDTRPIVLILSLSAFVLFLTLRIVESRRWK
jgi:gliding motility-associated transport system permease protein